MEDIQERIKDLIGSLSYLALLVYGICVSLGNIAKHGTRSLKTNTVEAVISNITHTPPWTSRAMGCDSVWVTSMRSQKASKMLFIAKYVSIKYYL